MADLFSKILQCVIRYKKHVIGCLRGKHRKSKVILIAGLPGSGKTRKLNKCEKPGYKIFDNYKEDANKDCPRFCCSQYFLELIRRLKGNRNCILSDIDFCDSESRAEAENFLKELAPEATWKWIFYEKNPEACEINIREREKHEPRNLQKDLNNLAKYSQIYNIPKGVVPLPVWQPE